jgi:TetR/AcrR family tetracycline transcriptional repressor
MTQRKRAVDEGERAGPAVADSATPAPSGLPAPPWASREATRRRRRRPPLDRDVIVATALRIVDAEGVAALSLRRLAVDLGVSPMSMYWHIRDKAELLELVGQAVLAEIEVPDARGDWRQQTRDIHRSMFEGFLRHPNTADLLIGRARYGAGGLGLFERILTILLEAGFPAEAAFDAYQSLYVFTLGSMATSTRTEEFREVQRQGVAFMQSLPEDRFASIRAVAPVIGRRSLEEQFEIGLDVQVEGIAARLLPGPA